MDDSEASPPVEEPTKAGRKRQARVNPGQPSAASTAATANPVLTTSDNYRYSTKNLFICSLNDWIPKILWSFEDRLTCLKPRPQTFFCD